MLILGDDTTLQAAIDVVDVGALGKGDFTVVKMAPGKTLVDGGIVPGTVTSDNELFVQVVVTAGMDGTVVLKVRPPATGTVFSFQ